MYRADYCLKHFKLVYLHIAHARAIALVLALLCAVGCSLSSLSRSSSMSVVMKKKSFGISFVGQEEEEFLGSQITRRVFYIRT